MQGGLTRRRFVAGAVGAGAAVTVGGAIALGRRGGETSRRVVVVGAGLAGLSAAYELGKVGFEVVVLEARDRIGGRAYTVREPFAGGQHAEAGGEFVDVPHRALRAYVRDFGMELEDVRGGGGAAAAFVRGRRLRWARLRDWRALDPFYSRLNRLSRPIDPDDPGRRGAELDEHSAADLIDRAGIRGIDRMVLETIIRDDYGAEASELSLLGMAAMEQYYVGTSGSGIEAFRIRGGNLGLAEQLAERSGADIRLASPATAIARDADSVAVEAGGESFEAAWCVVAAPLPALRGIEFEPALPEALAGAIAEMQYARVVKTMTQYGSRFWRRLGLSGDLYTDLPMGSAWEATDRQPGRRGILLAYAAGRTHDRLVDVAAGDEPAAVAADLDRVYPGSADQVVGAAAFDWAADPWAGGCWMQPAPGQVVPYWRAMREPVGRIVLAGEHASTVPGYMEGAIRSGIAAATAIEASGQI
jgi:monoamine oxidase